MVEVILCVYRDIQSTCCVWISMWNGKYKAEEYFDKNIDLLYTTLIFVMFSCSVNCDIYIHSVTIWGKLIISFYEDGIQLHLPSQWWGVVKTSIWRKGDWYTCRGLKLVFFPDSKYHGANIRPNWVLSAPDRPHVGPMNLAIRVSTTIWYNNICYITWCRKNNSKVSQMIEIHVMTRKTIARDESMKFADVVSLSLSGAFLSDVHIKQMTTAARKKIKKYLYSCYWHRLSETVSLKINIFVVFFMMHLFIHVLFTTAVWLNRRSI